MWKLLMPLSFYLAAGRHDVCPNCELKLWTKNDGKLAICSIHQNAHGAFSKLMSGLEEDRFPPPGLKQKEAYEELLNDTTWQKVVFYREPLVRFLSGFLARCKGEGDHGPCPSTFGRMNVTFEEALYELPRRWAKKHERMDAHFRPQIDFCGGIGHGLAEHYTMIALEPATSRIRVQELLAERGLQPPQPVFDKFFPKDGKEAGAIHLTHAFEKAEEYYNRAKYVGIAVNFFYKDFVTFRIPLPKWAEKHLDHLAKVESRFAVAPKKYALLKEITRLFEKKKQEL